jgi:hypothetical protein
VFGTVFDDISVGPRAPLVGFGRGRIGGANAIDPGSRDLSIELPFTTGVEGAGPGGMRQTVATTPVPGYVLAPGRAFAGQALTWNVANVPPGALLGAQLIDFAASRPGLFVPGLMAPGTSLGVTAGAVLWEVDVAPGASVTGTVPLLIPPGVEGAELFAQYVLLDGLFGGPHLITATSNTLRHEIGWQ